MIEANIQNELAKGPNEEIRGKYSDFSLIGERMFSLQKMLAVRKIHSLTFT